MKKTVKFMCEVAIFTAIGIVLDYVAGLYSAALFPEGGSIGIAMIAIFIMAYRWGLPGGLLTGLCIGLIQTFYGAYFVHPAQIFLDYWGAYTVVGMSGFFARLIVNAKSKTKTCVWISVSVLVGCLLRLLCAFLSGYIFFAEYAPEGMNPAVYSLTYNGAYLLPSAVLCAVILCIMAIKAPKLFTPAVEFEKLSKESIFSATVLFASIITLFIFTGKFVYKYDADWNKLFSDHIIGYDVVFGISNKYIVGEDKIAFNVGVNFPALLVFIFTLITCVVAVLPNKWLGKGKFIVTTLTSAVSMVFSFFITGTMESSIKAATNNVVSPSAYLPLKLLCVYQIILVIISLVLFLILQFSKKEEVK